MVCLRNYFLNAFVGIFFAAVTRTRAIDCYNDGVNVNGTCVCTLNFGGKNCEIDLLCPDRLCQNRGVCYVLGDYRHCICHKGTGGKYCESVATETKADIKCKNSGTGMRLKNGEQLCNCPPMYTGMLCGTSIMRGNCFVNPCVSGKCINHTSATYGCNCIPGFEGLLCDKISDQCHSSPCKNSGICVPSESGFSCICMIEFQGKNCEEPVCTADTCVNGICIVTVDGYRCDCDPSFTGKRCERAIDPCAYVKCENDGWCEPRDGEYVCRCPEGYTGTHCEREEYIYFENRRSIEKSVDNKKTKRRHWSQEFEAILASAFIALFVGVVAFFAYTFYNEKKRNRLLDNTTSEQCTNQKYNWARMFRFASKDRSRNVGYSTDAEF